MFPLSHNIWSGSKMTSLSRYYELEASIDVTSYKVLLLPPYTRNISLVLLVGGLPLPKVLKNMTIYVLSA